MLKEIYLDMDGVLCNFAKAYKEMHGDDVFDNLPEDESLKDDQWNEFVEKKGFQTLEPMPDAWQLFVELLNFCNEKGIHLHILSSTGRRESKEELTTQKTNWLINYRINNYFNTIIFVPGKALKKDYATEDSLLIDDHKSNVADFISSGGKAILHTSTKDTLEQLYSMFKV